MAKRGLFDTPDGGHMLSTFVLITVLFLLWGFCNGLIDVLNKHFQSTLHINQSQSGLVETANYIAYFLMALPAGLLARRFGYKGGIIIGLVLIAAGAFWFVPAIKIGDYWAFLAGLFVLASGLACLETIANPYTTVLGPPQTGATRINIAQTFNGIGWILGPVVGGHFIFGGQQGADVNAGLFIPYISIGIIVLVLIAIFGVAYVPDLKAHEEDATTGISTAQSKPLWARQHFLFGVAAQFFYVAAQAGIFAFFINYVLANRAGVTPTQAATWLGIFGFGLFLAGRACGSVVIGFSKPSRALTAYACCSLLACLLAMLGGTIGLIGVFASFFFMSIMYPTIFALAIHGLGEGTKLGSSLIVMAVVGGAVAPPLMGHLGDLYSVRMSFVLPVFCFAAVGAYGLLWPRFLAKDALI